jgi:hypothetical protein
LEADRSGILSHGRIAHGHFAEPVASMDSYQLKMLETLCMPSGPFDDVRTRAAAERWSMSLSTDDAGKLLDWIEQPVFPTDRGAVDPRWLEVLRSEAARFVGLAGKRATGGGIRERLEAMLGRPELRMHGLVGLRVLADPASVDGLRILSGDTNHQIIYELGFALAEIATPEAIAFLEEMYARRHSEPFVGTTLRDFLADAKAELASADAGMSR